MIAGVFRVFLTVHNMLVATALTLVFTASIGRAVSERDDPQYEELLSHQTLTTWTTDQGLPQNFIRAITQTSDGFLWIGTMNGLVRFDGLRFRPFGTEIPALRGNIGGLEPDDGEGLWVATSSSLFHYKGGRFLTVPDPGISGFHLEAVAPSQPGEMWVYGEHHLYRTEQDAEGHDRLKEYALPSKLHTLLDLAETADGSLWIADGDAVYAEPHISSGQVSRSARAVVRYPLPGVRMLYSDRFGDLFAGDGHRLFRFDGKTFTLIRDPGLGNFVSVYVDEEKNLWMASGGLHGVSRASLPLLYSQRSGKAHRESFTTANGLASNDARLIFEDRRHDIWIGTISGLQRLHRGLFISYTPGEDLANGQRRELPSQVDAVFQQKDGSLWIGTLEGGIARFKEGRWRSYSSSNGLKPGQVRGFAENGALPAVAISDYGIFAMKSGGRFAKIPGVPDGYLFTPVTSPDGSLWFGVQRKGLFRKIGEKIVRYGAAEGIPESDKIGLISLDQTGALWIGAGSNLLRWNGSRFEMMFRGSLPALCVAWPLKMTGDKLPEGIVIGTRAGLFFPAADGNGGRMMEEKDGLPGEMVLDANQDAGGNLWIATTRAIARLEHEQWMGFATGKLDHVHAEIYTRADGLGSNTVLPLPAVSALRMLDGRMVFATERGFSMLSQTADLAEKAESATRAVVDSVKVDDREQSVVKGGSLLVPPGQHRITFSYTTPPVVAPEQVRFRYRLSGWDHTWSEAGNDLGSVREVSYTALPPGSYTFEVSAITRSNRASAFPARLSLKLKPYFWQTRWFLILASIALAALLIEITRRRTRAGAERLSLQFQERAAERERIAYQIHDTVIQDMIGAALQLETVSFQVNKEPEKASSNLNKLAERMRETIARSRNMVWSLHSTAVVQYSLMEVLQHAEAEFRMGERPRFELTSEGESRGVHPLVRDEVYRICREALANAFRHSNADLVCVQLRFLPDLLEVEIRDDGEGIDEYTRLHGRPGHFGLTGMQAHAQRIGAQITILSTPGEGTQILMRVKTSMRRWRWRKPYQSAPEERQEAAI